LRHPFADLIGLRLTSSGEGRSITEVTVVDELFNPQQVVHGAVAYALADTGMGAALYSLTEPGELIATIEITIHYLAPVRGGELACATRVVNKGRRVATLESEIRVGDAIVAKALGSYSIFTPRG
jgi:acyl-CoA thioesterase